KGPVQHGGALYDGDREKKKDEDAQRERHGGRPLTAASLLRPGENESVLLAPVNHGRAHAPFPALVVRFQHSHPIAAGTFANVGIKGPPENIDSGGAMDLTFACEYAAGRGANVKSAPPGRYARTTTSTSRVANSANR